VARLGMEWDSLDESYNYPINLKTIDARRPPVICHYHDAATLMREPAAMEVVKSLVKEYRGLAEVLAADGAWSGVLESLDRPLGAPRELVITGIPRSGTSYLCNLLHRFDNCVVLNEPEEIGPALEGGRLPWPVAAFFRDRRRDVWRGVPIKNKLAEGEVVADTARANEQTVYAPKVAGGNFVLGVKSTIPFLSRLAALRRVMPEARFVTCVRNPLDTIASWKTSFAHLREADVKAIRIGHPGDPGLSEERRAELMRIASIGDLAVRRAEWWNYLAGLILEAREDSVVVRYEDLVGDPMGQMGRVTGEWEVGKIREGDVAASSVRSKRECLDEADLRAIASVCGKVAGEFGYECGELRQAARPPPLPSPAIRSTE